MLIYNCNTRRFAVLAPAIQEGKITRDQVKALYNSGWLKAKDPRAGLKENIKALLGLARKPRNTVAHHDAVIARELDFLQAGIDPNEGDLGRFISEYKHRLWHKRGNGHNDHGGPFNAAWNKFFIDYPNATAAQIRQRIRQMQDGTFTMQMADGTIINFRYP